MKIKTSFSLKIKNTLKSGEDIRRGEAGSFESKLVIPHGEVDRIVSEHSIPCGGMGRTESGVIIPHGEVCGIVSRDGIWDGEVRAGDFF